MKWIGKKMGGYVRLRLKGGSPERFFNLCCARGIQIWDILCLGSGEYECFMEVKGFRQIRPLVKKSGVRPHIAGRFGLPFFLYRNRSRWYYGAGLMAFFLVIFFMSRFIWKIEIQGNYRYTRDTIMTFLEGEKIKSGIKKRQVDCDMLEASIRSTFPEITWVSAQVSGTRLAIYVKENEALSEIPEKDTSPCHIVADKQGVITSMVVRSGIPKVKVGDAVEPGQILIDGYVPIIGDDGQEISGYMVRADGDIEVKTVRTYEREIPMLCRERVPTGKEKRGWYVKAGKWLFTCLFPPGREGEWDYTMEEHQLRLLGDLYLPVYGGRIKGRQMVSYERRYSQKELELLSKAVNLRFAKNLEEKGVQILENNDKIEKSVSQCRLMGELVTEESIGRPERAREPVTTPDAGSGTEPEETKTAQ